ncbi:MAG: hypothetical protein HYY93_05090 [Planctomycetes bacterium]|nr:hypothetical protein [Planctomycetota bacterium]
MGTRRGALECAAGAAPGWFAGTALAVMIALLAFAECAREAQAQTTGGGGIIIIGVDLSGQWEFDMTVLNASDPAMIGRTFTGSFTVSGGVPTYTGDGTFNGLYATISGNGAVDPADGTTIVLSDHIATTDSATTFTATVMSGNFSTGTFTGGTTDGAQTWEGVFTIVIARPTIETPEERIGDVIAVAAQEMRDTVSQTFHSRDAIVENAWTEASGAPSSEEALRILRKAHRELVDLSLVSFRLMETSFESARSVGAAIVEAAPMAERSLLHRLLGRKTGDLGSTLAQSKTRVRKAIRYGDFLLQNPPFGPQPEPPKKKQRIKRNAAGQSDYTYPNDPDKPEGPRDRVKLDKTIRVVDTTVPPDRVDDLVQMTHPFEIVVPKGDGKSRNKIVQWAKTTVTYGDGSADKIPKPEDPEGKGVGGYESPGKGKDDSDGPNPKAADAHDPQDNGDGTLSYADNTGVGLVTPPVPVK